MSRWRIAAWVVAVFFLLANAVAMHFTDQVNWSVADFVFAGVLLFGALGAYEIVARTTGSAMYRSGVGLALAATFLLLWGNAAVGITDSAADGMYLAVAAVGVVGVIIALFQPGGGAYALLTAALALVLVSGVALIAGVVPNDSATMFEVVGITGFYVVLFVGAAWLLRKAAGETAKQGAA